VARTEKTQDIDGVKYTATQLPPLTAFPLWLRVSTLLTSVLGRVDLRELASGKLDPASAMVLVSALRDDERLIPDLLASVSCTVGKGKGQEILDLDSDEAINRAFAGELARMVKVAVFAGTVNFAGPFAELFGGLTEQAEKLAEELERPDPGIPIAAASRGSD
jgi:hypothetical protein